MKYYILALVIQIFALIFSFVALGIECYIYDYDRKWFQVVQVEEHVYFVTFMTEIYNRWYAEAMELEKFVAFSPHHRMRTHPPDEKAGNFLRHPKSETNIFISLVILVAAMQLIIVIITCVRGIRFLPQPCRESGGWHLIIGIIATAACLIELLSRIDINKEYSRYKKFDGSTDPNEQIGGRMLASCGSDGGVYETKLGSDLTKKRDELYVCQRWYFFIVVIVLEFINAILCYVVALLLCRFWKKNTEKADAESLEREQEEGNDAESNQEDSQDDGGRSDPDHKSGPKKPAGAPLKDENSNPVTNDGSQQPAVKPRGRQLDRNKSKPEKPKPGEKSKDKDKPKENNKSEKEKSKTPKKEKKSPKKDKKEKSKSPKKAKNEKKKSPKKDKKEKSKSPKKDKKDKSKSPKKDKKDKSKSPKKDKKDKSKSPKKDKKDKSKSPKKDKNSKSPKKDKKDKSKSPKKDKKDKSKSPKKDKKKKKSPKKDKKEKSKSPKKDKKEKEKSPKTEKSKRPKKDKKDKSKSPKKDKKDKEKSPKKDKKDKEKSPKKDKNSKSPKK